MTPDMIQVRCINTQQEFQVPAGSTLKEILKQTNYTPEFPIVCARVNNKNQDLNFRIYHSKEVYFIPLTESSGMRAYVRTLCFLFFKALDDLYPNSRLRIEHPVSKGYFCKLQIGQEVTQQVIKRIKMRIDELILQNIPIETIEAPIEEAIKEFEKRNMKDKVLLLRTYTKPFVVYQKIGSHIDYYYGSLLTSTGGISQYDIIPYKYGVILQIPNRKTPDRIEEFIQQPKLFNAFEENAKLNEILRINTVGKLNHAICNGHASDLLKLSEVLHEKQIGRIADEIASRSELKVVLISGPSSSGKTTFSKRLCIQLMANLKRPIAISLDNYFVERAYTPIDEYGKPDYESLYALDLTLFNENLSALLRGEEVNLPTYNFDLGKREYKGNTLQLKPDDILILEGIHALNPELTPQIEEKIKYRIYVSALTAISLDDHNWIPTTDNRLLRRIIRDSKYRSHSAEQTISMWESVRRGEEKWIFPYQENADAMFNSALTLELSTLRRYVEPLLLDVPQNKPEFAEAHRLLRFLSYFKPIKEYEIPPTSLIREFLGGSSFKY